MKEQQLSHLNAEGQPSMVDVSAKQDTARVATASGSIKVGADIMAQLADKDFTSKKGSIIQTAIIAGTMSVKNTYNVIPLCHQIPISSCKIHIEPSEDRFLIRCTVKTNGKTGVEMEALHGVSVVALTIYDMVKALSHDMEIGTIQLETKTGGKHDFKR